MVYHSLPCSVMVYHVIPWYTMVYQVIPWYTSSIGKEMTDQILRALHESLPFPVARACVQPSG